MINLKIQIKEGKWQMNEAYLKVEANINIIDKQY